MKKTIKQLAAAFCIALATCEMAYADVIRPENDWLIVSGGSSAFYVGEDVRESIDAFFEVSSGSAATIKVSGLPSGVKFDARTQTISGVPTKRGVYYVTLSAQNGNGYKQTCIAEWNVGNASNGDYDEIGIDWENLENLETGLPVAWRTGEKVYFSLLYAFDNDDLFPVSESGLPPTLSMPKCAAYAACGYPPGTYHGTLTKAGKYKVTVTAKPWGGGALTRKAVKTIIVQDSGCRYLNVISTTPSRGTATGSKVYAIGAKASISAKAAKGYYFAGWYRDANFLEPLEDTSSGDWRKASDSIVVTEEIADTGIYARFVSSGEDDISIDCDDTWNVETGWYDSFDVDVQSMTLPTVSVKGLPSGVTWNKSRFALESIPSKLKPGVSVATITVKSLSGRTATKNVRIVVPNLQSWVFDGLDYSDSAYRLMVGVSDLCVPGWVSFDYDTDYKVTASGLPPGLKLSMSGGYAHILGTPTKAGTYTVTLTAKRGNAVEKATFTINIDPLPGYAIGTFNGVLRDEMSGEIAGSFTFTAAATGRLSVKVVTELGTMSLSSSAWNCYDAENRPMAYFSKYSKNEDFSFTLTPWEGEVWNCEHQLVGSLSWRKSSAGGESLIEAVIDTAQRNPFGKTGGVYDHPSAVKVAESLASEHKSTEMAILWDYELNAYRLECATCVLPGFSDGTATLRMNKNGTATVSGKLYGRYSFSSASVLTFDTECVIYDSHLFGEHFYAVFTPVVKMNECALSIVSGKCLTTNELVPILWFPLE